MRMELLLIIRLMPVMPMLVFFSYAKYDVAVNDADAADVEVTADAVADANTTDAGPWLTEHLVWLSFMQFLCQCLVDCRLSAPFYCIFLLFL